ncbi:MAG: HD domain-containing protein [Desulfopila sp.]
MQAPQKLNTDCLAAGIVPQRLVDPLAEVQRRCGVRLYLSGGTLRDWLLGRTPLDLDVTVRRGAAVCCRELINILGAGTLVPLGTQSEEAARVVWGRLQIDISDFRKGAQTIEEELALRDFTINAMAMAYRDSRSDSRSDSRIIDPLDGRKDLSKGLLRCCPEAFEDDPLRMLRGYRFQAELGFALTGECVAAVTRQHRSIQRCAAERILYELDRIMMCGAAAHAVRGMAETGLLWTIVPELYEGVGVEQPGYHHKDVFYHSLLTLDQMERVIQQPQSFFGASAEVISEYLADATRVKNLRWAALFHDLGKPVTCSSGTMCQAKVTFYNHDRVGRQLFLDLAGRLRMSRRHAESVGTFIELHMHPFHLSNVRRTDALSRKALLKICKKAQDDLAGLFVLAMADSLAGQGELKPADMEEQLAELFDEIQAARKKHVEPVLYGKRLLSGHDLIERFGLRPGPLFKEILGELDVARVEGRVATREQAMAWVEKYLEEK